LFAAFAPRTAFIITAKSLSKKMGGKIFCVAFAARKSQAQIAAI
jgi:hypothetical protein